MRFLRLALAALGFPAAGALAQPHFLSPADIDALPSTPADERFAYGPDSPQFGDLRLPGGPGLAPVAVVIHGGCWVESYADLRNTAALADALRRDGFATWNLEYRRLDQPGGGWPGTFLDVARGIDALRILARRHPLDLRRVIVIGHSAGGQLALWAAARHKLPPGSELFLPEPLAIAGVVGIGTPADLARFRLKESQTCGDAVVTKLMGGGPDRVPVRYAQGSPFELLPLGVRQILVTGSDDFIEGPPEGAAYVAAARRAGDRAEQRVIPDSGHHEYNSPETPAGRATRAAARALAGLPDR
jgi:acetyl esterase/lipase